MTGRGPGPTLAPVAYDGIRAFVDDLDRGGELVRVTEPVSAELEITAVADAAMKSPGGGKALLFESVVLPGGGRSEFPVGINLFG